MNTSKITLKSFIKSAGQFEPSLVRAVVSQCGGWDAFKTSAEDVTNHGGNGGTFGGFIYYVDTITFARKNKKNIVSYLEEQAKDLGDSSLIESMKGWNILQGNYTPEEIGKAIYGNYKDNDSCNMILNALSIVIQEEVCRAYSDMIESM